MRYNIVQAVDHLLQQKVMIVTHISVYLMTTMKRISNSQRMHLEILKT